MRWVGECGRGGRPPHPRTRMMRRREWRGNGRCRQRKPCDVMSDRRALVGGSYELESGRSEWWLGQGCEVLGGDRKGSGFYPECSGVNRVP